MSREPSFDVRVRWRRPAHADVNRFNSSSKLLYRALHWKTLCSLILPLFFFVLFGCYLSKSCHEILKRCRRLLPNLDLPKPLFPFFSFCFFLFDGVAAARDSDTSLTD